MDLGLIIAIVGTGIAMVGVTIALFLWNRSEANSDRRDIINLVLAIQSEIRDFHNRLIKIEMERK
jgi:hypothetical protein